MLVLIIQASLIDVYTLGLMLFHSLVFSERDTYKYQSVVLGHRIIMMRQKNRLVLFYSHSPICKILECHVQKKRHFCFSFNGNSFSGLYLYSLLFSDMCRLTYWGEIKTWLVFFVDFHFIFQQGMFLIE